MVTQEYGLEKTPILWLSRVANQKNCVRPSPPENVAMAVEHFISVGQDSVVLLDGFEYLVAHNDFPSILALVKREVRLIEPPSGPKLVPRVEVEVAKAGRKSR